MHGGHRHVALAKATEAALPVGSWQPMALFRARSGFCGHGGDEALKRAAGLGPASSHRWQPLAFPGSETLGDEWAQGPVLHFARREDFLFMLPCNPSISAKKGNLVSRPTNHEMWSRFNKTQDICLISALNDVPST